MKKGEVQILEYDVDLAVSLYYKTDPRGVQFVILSLFTTPLATIIGSTVVEKQKWNS